jgi:DNA-binding transcriptional LysR family regulator
MKIENIADLRVLVQTAKAGSLTAAAAAIGITPAAASATLKRLETQLDVRLPMTPRSRGCGRQRGSVLC